MAKIKRNLVDTYYEKELFTLFDLKFMRDLLVKGIDGYVEYIDNGKQYRAAKEHNASIEREVDYIDSVIKFIEVDVPENTKDTLVVGYKAGHLLMKNEFGTSWQSIKELKNLF